MEIVRFEKQYIEQAAELLVGQLPAFLAMSPRLVERIGEAEIARDYLAALLMKKDSSGVVMLEGSCVSGYLLGAYRDNPFFGQHVMVPFGGISLKDQATAVSDLVQLYAAAGKRWMGDGVFNHYLVMPALTTWLEAGFSLSFGKEQAYAIASLAEQQPEPDFPEGIVLREAISTDAEGLYHCADWIAGHYNLAPVWEPVPAEHLADIRAGYAALADDAESTTWLALDGERIVSFVVIYPEEMGPDNLLGDPKVVHFSVAASHPTYREKGIGRALLNHAMNMAQQQGYDVMTTDWRTTNPEAATHWPSFGFEPYAYRLLRRVNPRYESYSVSP